METKARRDIEITLIMTEKEAIWLKGVMQNPLHSKNPIHESLDDKQMRSIFFEALHKELGPC